MARQGDQWHATIELGSSRVIEFKFFRKLPDGSVEWETGDNRSVAATQRLEATWR